MHLTARGLMFIMSTIPIPYVLRKAHFFLLICSGYMAPEYAFHGQFSVKSDVYSFGVLVLEIVSGQKNSCFRHGDNVEDLLTLVSKNIM